MTAVLSITDVISSLCDKAVGGAPEIEDRQPQCPQAALNQPAHRNPEKGGQGIWRGGMKNMVLCPQPPFNRPKVLRKSANTGIFAARIL
jgi:hypothetical protein